MRVRNTLISVLTCNPLCALCDCMLTRADLSLDQLLGGDFADPHGYGRCVGKLALAGVHSDAQLLRVAAVLLGRSIAQLDAQLVDQPEKWVVQPMSGHVWDANTWNPSTLLLLFQDHHWNPAMPHPTIQQLPAAPFGVPELSALVHNTLHRDALPLVWGYFGVFGPAATNPLLECLFTSAVILACNPTEEIPVVVTRSVLGSGWQLTWTTTSDPTSIHRPPTGMSQQIYIMHPLDARHQLYCDSEVIARFFSKYLRGADPTRDLVIVVPLLDAVSFTTAVLSPTVMGYYTPEPEYADNVFEIHVKLQHAWEAWLPPKYARPTPSDKQRATTPALAQRGGALVKRRFITSMEMTPFESEHATLKAYAMYYAAVAAARAGVDDAIPFMVREGEREREIDRQTEHRNRHTA